MFVRFWATVSTHVSITKAEHSYYELSVIVIAQLRDRILTSLSLNSQKPFQPRLGA